MKYRIKNGTTMNINIGNKGLHKTAVDIDISFFVPVDLFGPDARLSGRE